MKGASQNNLADWWPQVEAQFDGPTPQVRDLLVDWKGKTTVALYFETDRFPYVVKNPTGGPFQRDVPWREGTAVRSATHSDLVLLLSPLQRPILNIEVGKGRGFVNHYPLAKSGPSTDADLVRPEREVRTAFAPSRATAAYYLRVKVVNRGRRTARDCNGFLANLEVWCGGAFCETNYADFMRLVWSNYAGSPSLDLLPDVPHWLDLVSTLEHHSRFFLETDPKATRYANGFDDTSVYRLTIKVFAEDAEPAQSFVYLHWDRRWDSLDVFDETEWESRQPRLT